MFVAFKALGYLEGEIILTFQGDDAEAAVSSSGIERRLWRILLRGVEGIVVVSDSLGAKLLTVEPTAHNKMRTIHNAVDLEKFTHDKTSGRQPLSIKTERIIVSVAGFEPRKAHHITVEAFAIVARRIPNVHLVLIGNDGPELDRIRQLVGALSLDEKVSLLKDIPHERIPEFLSQADLFVLASRSEGHPLAVIEAGAAHLPVVCTRAPGSLDLVSDQITGRLVEIDNKDALAEAIVDVLMNPQKAQQMATKFFEHIKSSLTWEHSYKGYLQLIDDDATRLRNMGAR